jgi:hypothetical protein
MTIIPPLLLFPCACVRGRLIDRPPFPRGVWTYLDDGTLRTRDICRLKQAVSSFEACNGRGELLAVRRKLLAVRRKLLAVRRGR